MKKIISIASLIVLLFCNSSLGFSQRLGLDAGYTMDFLQQEHNGVTASSPVLMNGVYVGPRFEFFFKDSCNWAISFATEFEMRAARYDISWYKDYSTCFRQLYYILIPVDVSYYLPVTKKGLKVQFFGGPRLNIGVYGEFYEHYFMATRKCENVNPFGTAFKGSEMNRFDASFGVGVGVDYKGFFAKIFYDFPITNSAGTQAPDVLRQHELKIGMGYLFDLGSYLKNAKQKKSRSRRSFVPNSMKAPRAIPGMEQGGFIRR